MVKQLSPGRPETAAKSLFGAARTVVGRYPRRQGQGQQPQWTGRHRWFLGSTGLDQSAGRCAAAGRRCAAGMGRHHGAATPAGVSAQAVGGGDAAGQGRPGADRKHRTQCSVRQFLHRESGDGTGGVRAHALGARGHRASSLAGRNRTHAGRASRCRALDSPGWRTASGQYATERCSWRRQAKSLPLFTGPEESAARVLARYEEFRDRLGAIGRSPVAVHLSAREAWQVKLDDGLVLELGRDQARHPLAERVTGSPATTQK